MKVEVTVPEDYMGDVIGDLNSRRGRIEGMELAMALKLSTHLFRFPKCLVMLPTCVLKLKAEATTLWKLTITKMYRETLPSYHCQKQRHSSLI